MTDSDVMPWGKFKGEKIGNVPGDYLIWIYENNKCFGEVKQYIKDNLTVLKTEIARQKK